MRMNHETRRLLEAVRQGTLSVDEALLKHFADEFWGTADTFSNASPTETVLTLSCNVDDMTGEKIGFAMDQLFDAGALDVYTIPTGMKKSRPGTLLQVLCLPEKRDMLLSLLFLHTTTLGVRENLSHRYTLTRRTETLKTPFGTMRQKISQGYGVTRVKPEYEDLAWIARKQGKSLKEIQEILSVEET